MLQTSVNKYMAATTPGTRHWTHDVKCRNTMVFSSFISAPHAGRLNTGAAMFSYVTYFADAMETFEYKYLTPDLLYAARSAQFYKHAQQLIYFHLPSPFFMITI